MVNTDPHEASGHIKNNKMSHDQWYTFAQWYMSFNVFFPFFLAFKVLIESSEAVGDFVTYKAKVKTVLKKGKSISNMICVDIL